MFEHYTWQNGKNFGINLSHSCTFLLLAFKRQGRSVMRLKNVHESEYFKSIVMMIHNVTHFSNWHINSCILFDKGGAYKHSYLLLFFQNRQKSTLVAAQTHSHAIHLVDSMKWIGFFHHPKSINGLVQSFPILQLWSVVFSFAFAKFKRFFIFFDAHKNQQLFIQKIIESKEANRTKRELKKAWPTNYIEHYIVFIHFYCEWITKILWAHANRHTERIDALHVFVGMR